MFPRARSRLALRRVFFLSPCACPREQFENVTTVTDTLSTDRCRPGFSLGDIVCLLVPALMFLKIDVGGVVFATDVGLLGLLLLLLAKRRQMPKGDVTMVCVLGVAWLGAQVLSDIVQSTPPGQFIRGWSKISLTITHFLTIALLIQGKLTRFVLFGVGLAVGGMLTYFISPSEYAISLPWKFGLAFPITLITCVLAAKAVAPKSKIGAVGLVFPDRRREFVSRREKPSGGVCLLAAVYSVQPKLTHKLWKRKGMVFSALAMACGLWAIREVYSGAAEQGWLGIDAARLYLSQSSGAGGLLLGGRSDLIAATAAIIDSPVIGHGSWARDPQYVAYQEDRRAALGYKSQGVFDAELIPSHSHLFGAWVESGITGAAFWAWVLWLTIRTLTRANGAEPLFPYFVFLSCFQTWNILFSPYGAEQRFIATYSMYAMILLSRISHYRPRRRTYVHNIHRYNLFQPRVVLGTDDPVCSGAEGSRS